MPKHGVRCACLLGLGLLLPILTFANRIIQRPIVFDRMRQRLTRQYQRERLGIHPASIYIKPRIVVVHWTVLPTLQQAFQRLNPATLVHRRDLQSFSQLNVSAHFLVDRDGTIYQLLPTNVMARHVIGLNHVAIGIENVGGIDDQADLTPAQLEANVYLIRYLKRQYPSIRHVIGHYEYQRFINTPLWREKDPRYLTQKRDPGTVFMRQLRTRLGERICQPLP